MVSLLSVVYGITRLFVLLLCGCGLRLRELLHLRIKDIDFDNQQIIIRDGKGFKDRTVMLPESTIPLLIQQKEYALALYNEDRFHNSPGVEIPYSLDRKYPVVWKINIRLENTGFLQHIFY